MQLADAMILAKGGAGAVIAGSLYLLGQWIAKRKPRRESDVDHQRAVLGLQAEERAAYDARLSSLGRELDQYRNRLELMEARVSRLMAERQHVYDLLIRLSLDHPTASSQILEEMRRMRELFSDG